MSDKHLTLLTGASRGMGLAMAQQLLAAGHDLLCIARKPDEDLAARAAAAGRRCEQWAQDRAAVTVPFTAGTEGAMAEFPIVVAA